MKLRSLLCLSLFALTGCATSTKPGAVSIDRPQMFLVSAESMEKSAAATYLQTGQEARSKGKLINTGPEHERLVRIAQRITRQVGIFRSDAERWNWEVMLIDQPTINANCMPGGKITFYTGIIRKLRLTDDEIAAVMGHEIAHALREHGRERVSEAMAQGMLTKVVATAAKANDSQVAMADAAAKYLISLPNSREHESEADKIGLELAARAGYDPRAAITLWQKMDASDGGKAPPEFFSTHPANKSRINALSELLPTVTPLYTVALAQNGGNASVTERARPSTGNGTNARNANPNTKFKDFNGTRCDMTETASITKIGAPATGAPFKGMSEVVARNSAGEDFGPAYYPAVMLKKYRVKIGDRVCGSSLVDND